MKMKVKNESGVTLIALVITIIIIIILAGITIDIGSENITKSADNRMKSELGIVQHAILERYTKAELTGEVLPGKAATDQIAEMEQTITKKDSETSNYYIINQTNANELGLKNIEYEYIVNYRTGEVFNLTEKTTSTGEALYIYAKSVENKE